MKIEAIQSEETNGAALGEFLAAGQDNETILYFVSDSLSILQVNEHECRRAFLRGKINAMMNTFMANNR